MLPATEGNNMLSNESLNIPAHDSGETASLPWTLKATSSGI